MKKDEIAELRNIVDSMPAQVFAVLDGAMFDGLTSILRAKSIHAVSLFRDHADLDVESAGPWLVSLNTARQIDEVFNLIAGCSHAFGVFWSCTTDEADTLRHLRTLNMVLLPTPGLETHEAVLFRHWDPNVLAIVLEVLRADQLIEVLGPAQQIAFLSPDFDGIFQCKTGSPQEVA
jgi:hypothetical protein